MNAIAWNSLVTPDAARRRSRLANANGSGRFAPGRGLTSNSSASLCRSIRPGSTYAPSASSTRSAASRGTESPSYTAAISPPCVTTDPFDSTEFGRTTAALVIATLAIGIQPPSSLERLEIEVQRFGHLAQRVVVRVQRGQPLLPGR